MSNKNTPKAVSPSVVITDTDQLSALADALLARAENPKLSKNTVLNIIAGSLVGPKTNWGGLKALASPIAASRLAGEMHCPTDRNASRSANTCGEDQPYRIDGTSLVLDFGYHKTGARYSAAVALTEIPALEMALFGHNSPGEYQTMHANFERYINGELMITTTFMDGHRADLSIDEVAFRKFLNQHRSSIHAVLPKPHD